jgi:hypothetical protein
VLAVTIDARVCGDSAVVGPRTGEGSLGNALVWIDGITAGKPLPEVRRQTFTIDGCRFNPAVLAVVTGTTINVFSGDPVAHDARFYREGEVDSVDRIRTMDAGQVVPSEEIAARPGMVEARCARHPWERGYVAVFDHPYFAVTDETGAFRIDALPPGTYNVKAWHHGMSDAVTQRVVVRPGGAGELALALPVGPAAPATPGEAAGPPPSP